MKYFKHLFDSTANALVNIFSEGRHADKVIEYYFRNNKKWGKRDRQFVAENVYGCVRWWNKYIYLTEAENDTPLVQANKAIAAHIIISNLPLPEWYAGLVDEANVRRRQREVKAAHIVNAFPKWIFDLGREELGSRWDEIAGQLNEPAKVVLRANTLKISANELIVALQKENFEAELLDESVPEAVVLKQRGNVFGTEAFKKGLFEVQDGSSQLVASFVNPQPGERIVDACAGAGGKSLHLAARMQNKGKIISLDVVGWKIDELNKRVRRSGASNIEGRVIDSTKVIKRLHESADALLLDVPCSGLGVIKRNPDTKWKLTPEAIKELHETQKNILQNYSAIVKTGGRMIYSTCSILPSENSDQVDAFVKANPQWKKIEEKSILPQSQGFDGFYMALLRLEGTH